MIPLVPPIKCQGIKTKIAPIIKECVTRPITGRWIEPFCGSCVVVLNVQPQRALLTDTNIHIINLYRNIQNGIITSTIVKQFLEQEGELLSKRGEEYYYEVRSRFNENDNPLDFIFLNRACFNGIMRFNRHGKFNVPYNHKPERFRQAYITKISNQIKNFSSIVQNKDWEFVVAPFTTILSDVNADDFVYADPPYAGRHVDYFNSWADEDEAILTRLLKNVPSRFLLSTWHSNKYRENAAITSQWHDDRFSMRTIEHFYHVGATENLRNSMLEALIANYSLPQATSIDKNRVLQQHAFAL